MRCVVIGAGGVGAYFGARLARAGEPVTFVARGAHLDAIRARGLRIRSAIDGEYVVRPEAVDDLDGHPPADVVLLCVKSFDTDVALDRVRPVVALEKAVLTLQNGIDSIERIDARLGPGLALGGAAYVFASIEAPGVIAHGFGGLIVFGEPDRRVTPRAERVRAAFAKAGVPVELSTDIRRVLWEKYLFICAQAGITALARAPIGVLRATPESWRMYRLRLGGAGGRGGPRRRRARARCRRPHRQGRGGARARCVVVAPPRPRPRSSARARIAPWSRRAAGRADADAVRGVRRTEASRGWCQAVTRTMSAGRGASRLRRGVPSVRGSVPYRRRMLRQRQLARYRGAPRLGRGASERRGAWGPVEAPMSIR